MCTSSESVPKSAVYETEAAAWLDNISFCSGFCQWIDEELSVDSLPAESQQPVQSTSASQAEAEAEAVSAQPSAEKSPTEVPSRGNRRSRIHAFFKRAWKAVKKPFLRCRRTRVESSPETASVPGPSGLQNVPDTEPASASGLPNWEPTTEPMYSLYTLQGLIGKGSFGKVFKAIRKSDGQEVAIKGLCKFNNRRYLKIPGCSAPLPREVALMLLLRRPPVSPYVIQMYEWFDRPKIFSLILECPQPCMVLRKFITVSSGLTETIASILMRQLVLAVQHCIDHGVFHNDIHADNILVTTDTLEIKLIDFGAAHLFESTGYDTWKYLGELAFCIYFLLQNIGKISVGNEMFLLAGAAEYCPPEAFSQPKYHAVPTNVWALGVTLYLMVNRRLPFYNIRETLEASPKFWKPTLSIACRDLIGQCLNRDPAKRPTLEQILEHPWFKRWL
ncbi:serine/threonine-protein kinase pim-2-like isoform X1 [Carassius auratus]|uniref:non-specific serine/threonine protein kinase n=1 Tax=Carassius auratus TaxID=7957 RepID=A0A6P6J3M8_CARAU|nr:serine/threonine-protein kinase pim-2-like isoform X1 [Carassius auratus]XP_026054719.1 serine/threonine-protein kinase pim-2-like isoform X1 [Carassius auratus]XP_026054720.1 serine/threonine-protein kinase pim-2-like isoform X1 [Carassius auratus]